MREVNLCLAWLILQWVDVFGWADSIGIQPVTLASGHSSQVSAVLSPRSVQPPLTLWVGAMSTVQAVISATTREETASSAC